MNLRIVTVLLAAVLSVGAARAQDHSLEQLVVEMANTAAEHEAVSKHYASQAAAAREDARHHKDMARVYAVGRNAQPQAQRHCEQLSKKFEEIAAEYDQLSKLHAEEAKKLAH